MFTCTTIFSCDICGTRYESHKSRITDCTNKAYFRRFTKDKGWKTISGKWDVCPNCIQRYGMKYLRNSLKEREQE